MPSRHPEPPPSTLGLKDILFVLFKHKWKILLSALVGLGAAAAVYFLQPPLYQSDAKLLVRYVLDRSSVDALESTSGSSKTTDNVINSEVEILTSGDLATQVAEAVGPERLAPGSPPGISTALAAQNVRKGLAVTPLKLSNVLLVSYTNRDPQLATVVLEDLLNRYFIKHLEIHRSAGAFDFVSQQTDQVKARLSETEDQLKTLKAEAKITSLVESTASLDAGLAKLREELHAAEAEQAEQRARVKEFERILGATPVAGENTPAAVPNPTDVSGQTSPNPPGSAEPEAAVEQPGHTDTQRYQALVAGLTQLRQNQLDLASKYTPGNQMVKLNEAQISTLDKELQALETRFPSLVATNTAKGAPSTRLPDLITERARLAGVEARSEALKSRLRSVEESWQKLSGLTPQITQLERKKELEEANYKYFAASLEKARIDEALDPSKIPNISIVQKPSLAARAMSDRNKLALAVAAGGVALGLGYALLRELVVDRTVKRPLELETRLHIPLLLSIPDLSLKNPSRVPLLTGGGGSGTALQKRGSGAVAPWHPDHFIRRFAEAIRDRLVLHFEISEVKHKPKLIAVAGFSPGAGSSTLAGGLAAALSETGDGKVLLVDMNAGDPELHPFYHGGSVFPLKEALQDGSQLAPAGENLYLATASSSSTAGPVQFISKKLFELMPQLKASDFDYIIFDMPPLTPTSSTLALSRLMDQVLLVVESGKNNLEVVRRGYAELLASKANVSAVFNKARSHGPKWLDDDV